LYYDNVFEKIFENKFDCDAEVDFIIFLLN